MFYELFLEVVWNVKYTSPDRVIGMRDKSLSIFIPYCRMIVTISSAAGSIRSSAIMSSSSAPCDVVGNFVHSAFLFTDATRYTHQLVILSRFFMKKVQWFIDITGV